VQPKKQDYSFDLDAALSAVVGLKVTVPSDAFTAETLGTERAGHGVIIRKDGLVLTIGYLVIEAETIWIQLNDGRAIPGHLLAYDHETGFGLVQALTRTDFPYLELGTSAEARIGDDVVVAGAGGAEHSLAARIIAKQEFAGYWEYLLDQALFTAPSHPNWGGTALIDLQGKLIGVGSLQLQYTKSDNTTDNLNMMVPIDLLKPILNDLVKRGRANRPVRPWLGLYATEVGNRLVIAGLSSRGPARSADLRGGDVVLDVAGVEVATLASFYRQVWSMGPAGVDIPMRVYRKGKTLTINVRSGDRASYFKPPTLH
jgi:S1-C subfamily serine protease